MAANASCVRGGGDAGSLSHAARLGSRAIGAIRESGRMFIAVISRKGTGITMAKTRRTRKAAPTRRSWKLVVIVVAVALAAVIYAYRTPISGYASAGTAYSARVACSCRFVGGRDLGDCAKDKIAGMEMVMLSEDEAAQSVTATIPLVRSDTAAYREGYGCVLQPWEG